MHPSSSQYEPVDGRLVFIFSNTLIPTAAATKAVEARDGQSLAVLGPQLAVIVRSPTVTHWVEVTPYRRLQGVCMWYAMITTANREEAFLGQ